MSQLLCLLQYITVVRYGKNLCPSIGEWIKKIHYIYIYRYMYIYIPEASQVALVVNNLPASAGEIRDNSFDLWVRNIPWRRARQPTPVFLPGESPWTEEAGGL